MTTIDELARHVLGTLETRPYPGSQSWTAAVDAIAASIRAALEAQYVEHCRAICAWCGDQRWEPAVFEQDGGYYHAEKKGKGRVWCDATAIHHTYSEAEVKE
jgi:hypothetical protein